MGKITAHHHGSSEEIAALQERIRQLEEELLFKDNVYGMVLACAKATRRHEFYDIVLEKAVSAISKVDKGTLLQLNPDGMLSFESVSGYDLESLRAVRLRLEESFLHDMTEGRYDRTIIINDMDAFNRARLSPEIYEVIRSEVSDIRSVMSAPIHIDGALWGMINLDAVSENAFSEEDVQRVSVFVAEITNIIAISDIQDQNTFLLQRDPLTGLLNRRFFTDRFRSELSEVQRGASPTTSGILISMDLDDFKPINDNHGHPAGDQALCLFAHLFEEQLGEQGYLSRYGGDEFAAVCPGMDDDSARDLIERVRRSLREQPILFAELSSPAAPTPAIIEFSAGTSTYDPLQCEYAVLMRLADQRMYEDKKRHKGRRRQIG